MSRILACLLSLAGVGIHSETSGKDVPWSRHTIDNSSRGADGVRLLDVNGDGHLDIATGWEEGGVIRAYLNPGPEKAAAAWPAVTVGNVKSAEDAVFVDLDGDGAVDVVSSCEGKTRAMFVHWAPSDPDQYLNPDAWKTEELGRAGPWAMWMFAMPLDIDGQNGVDLVAGSKSGSFAAIGWLKSPENPRDVSQWRFSTMRPSGWIMSVIAHDVDGDGDSDVLFSDHKGDNRGIGWLENPGLKATLIGENWPIHFIGAGDREVMFIDVHSPMPGGVVEVLAAVKPNGILRFRGGDRKSQQADVQSDHWVISELKLPADRIGTAKAVRRADMDLDGRDDLVFSCEQAQGKKSGVVWLTMDGDGSIQETNGTTWKLRELSGPTGVKFDLLQLVDLDADGDLDVITCEERANLGVFWYENPTQSPK